MHRLQVGGNMKSKKVRTYGYIKCSMCGVEVLKKHPKTTRCPSCQTKYHSKKAAEKQKRLRAAQGRSNQVHRSTECKKTKICRYGSNVGALDICNYMEIVGHSRGCPVENCKEFKRRKRGRKKKGEKNG